MKRKNLLLFGALFVLLSLTGCDVGFDDMETGSGPVIDEAEPYIPTVIRFETAGGDNLLTDLVVLPQGQSYYPIKLEDYPWLDIRCVRERDGAQMTFSTTFFGIPQGEEAIGQLGAGPVFGLSWIDFDILAAQNVSFPCQEHYTLRVRSTRFWLGEEHTITWGIEFQGRKQFSVFSCVIDGTESLQYMESAIDRTQFNGMIHLRSSK